MQRLIFVGSPREGGRSAHLADAIFEACIEDAPYDGVSVVSIAGMNIAGCVGCDGCRRAGEAPEIDKEDPLAPCDIVAASDTRAHVCVIDDDMAEVRKQLDAADELIVVCPVYFSGAPSQAKAALDRLQPYFWSDIRSHTQARRPMTLHIIGEGAGSDPYGAEGLIANVRSAFGVSGFRLEQLLDWTGCIDKSGEIVADARELEVIPARTSAQSKASKPAKSINGAKQGKAAAPKKSKERPKLDIRSGGNGGSSKSPSAQNKKKGRK